MGRLPDNSGVMARDQIDTPTVDMERASIHTYALLPFALVWYQQRPDRDAASVLNAHRFIRLVSSSSGSTACSVGWWLMAGAGLF
jgi:hypothetical protein